MAVAVHALVLAGEVAQVGTRPFGHHSLLCDSRDSWGVVTAVQECGITYVMVVGHETELGEQAGVLQVAARNGSSRVCFRHQSGLNLFCEGLSPQVRFALRVIEDPSHASLRSVGGS